MCLLGRTGGYGRRLYTLSGFENTKKKNQCSNGRFPAGAAWPLGQPWQREEQRYFFIFAWARAAAGAGTTRSDDQCNVSQIANAADEKGMKLVALRLARAQLGPDLNKESESWPDTARQTLSNWPAPATQRTADPTVSDQERTCQ